MEAPLWLHKSTESPRGHTVSILGGSLCAGRPFFCSLCLSFLAESSLTTERRQCYQSNLSLSSSLGASLGTDTEYQSASRAFKHLSLFISHCQVYQSKHTPPRSLSPDFFIPCNLQLLVPWNIQTKGAGVSRKEGVRVCRKESADLNTPCIKALVPGQERRGICGDSGLS